MKASKLKAIKVAGILLIIAASQALSSCAGWNGFWGISSGTPGLDIGFGGNGPIGGPGGPGGPPPGGGPGGPPPPPPPGGPW